MISINMLSKADSIKGQGVGSAFIEQVDLVKKSKLMQISVNSYKHSDIVHIHSINLEFYLKMLFTSSKKVVYCHFLPKTLDGSIKLPSILFFILKKYIISFYKRANYIIIVNPSLKNSLSAYGIADKKIKYIPNYVSENTFYPLELDEINQIKNKYKIPIDKFVVIGVGQIQTRKGIKDFVEVAKKNLEQEFIWVGGFSFGSITDGYKDLKKIVEEPVENLHFIGLIDRSEMNSIYNIADLLFMPSYNELFPMSILEASNVYKPVLVRDLDLYKDILFNYYLYANDNQNFSRIIKELANKNELYKNAQNNAKLISEFYCESHVLQLWEDFYSSCIK